MDIIWRGLDQAGLDRAYNARASVADYDAELRRYAELSAAARAAFAPKLDCVFDRASGLALDWFAGRPGGPVLLWIHGGYWRALTKSDQSLVAPGLVAAGVHVAVMDYHLAPAVTLDVIVEQVRTALAWVARNAAAFGADPSLLFAAGHSAGGHLVGELLAPGWPAEHGLPPNPLTGGIVLSGLFDLEPIRLSYINEWLRLDAPAASRRSPLHHVPPPGPGPRLLATYGGLESDEFRLQAENYAAAWSAQGHDARLAPQPTRHHFDLVVAFGDAADPLCRTVIDFIDPGRRPQSLI